MDGLHRISMICLAVVNVATFVVYGWDKLCAIQRWWRVPEKILLLLALIGGSVGAMAAMAVFRHKTQHLKFRYGIPLLFVLQLAGLLWLHLRIVGSVCSVIALRFACLYNNWGMYI